MIGNDLQLAVPSNGWGGGTRTHEMLESNSSAFAAWRRPNIKVHVYWEVHVIFRHAHK